jgi:ribosome-binding protein aMBF1 (putative translation factor)
VELPAFKKQFARRVRRLREARALRQDDLEEFGLSWKTVQKVEYGLTDPKASTMLKLSRAFGISLVELIDFDHQRQ